MRTNIKMGLRSLLLAMTLSIVGLTVSATPAFAQEAPPQMRASDCRFRDTSNMDQLTSCLNGGQLVRVEDKDKRQGTIWRWNPVTRALYEWTYIRPHGHAENFWTQSIYCTDAKGTVVGGTVCAAMHAQTSRVLSGNTTFGRSMAAAIPAAANGTGAALINNLLSPCRNGGCGPDNVNVINTSSGAISESRSTNQTAVGVDIRGLAACATGTCR